MVVVQQFFFYLMKVKVAFGEKNFNKKISYGLAKNKIILK
jgi:hypothetical protein